MNGLTREEIRARLSQLLEAFLKRREIPYDKSRFDDFSSLGIDSLGMMEVIFEIEEEFQIHEKDIPDETLQNIASLEDLVAIVADLMHID